MEQNSQSRLSVLRDAVLLEDPVFLQYMQFVWAYYQELVPPDAQGLDEFKVFTNHLTLMEKAVAAFTFPCSTDNPAIPPSSSIYEASYTVMRLRLQLMVKFNTLLSALEKKGSAGGDCLDRAAYHPFFEAIWKAYEQAREDSDEELKSEKIN